MPVSDSQSFAARIIRWQLQSGRHDLPWQGSRDPYRIWVAEVMLQQTQVQTVIGYYQRFMTRFPDVRALASAPQEAVMTLWSGLGYYSRARNLHRCAQAVVGEHGGGFPREPAALAGLPGIGRSTAAAIAVFAFGARAAILDGNVKRVVGRHFGVAGYPGESAVERQLWRIAERELPDGAGIEAYTQGLMDLGASLCARREPDCIRCPVRESCHVGPSGQWARFPAPRPARATPLKHLAMLVVIQSGRVLLERRPSRGVWGGLLSLPEVEVEAAFAPERLAGRAQTLGLPELDWRPLPAFGHAFTHYRLRVQPFIASIHGDAPALAEGASAVWIAFDKVADAALPRPVKSLLEAVARVEGGALDPG